MLLITLILAVLILAAAIAVPILLYRKAQAGQRAESDRLIARIEQALGSSVKLLEVKSYYDQTAGEYKKMLDEAYKEGNRFRQDHIRRLSERLEQLKARTLDRTVRMLEPQSQQPQFQRRRHRGGRRFHPAGQAPKSPGGQGPTPPGPKGPTPSAPKGPAPSGPKGPTPPPAPAGQPPKPPAQPG